MSDSRLFYRIQKINNDDRILDSVVIYEEDYNNILELFIDAYYSDKDNYKLETLERKLHSIRYKQT